MHSQGATCRDRGRHARGADVEFRRGEAVRLDVEDLDLAGNRAFILGKARSQKEPMTVPAPKQAALVAWLEARRLRTWTALRQFRPRRQRQTAHGLRNLFSIVCEVGTEAGLAVRPHGLRYLAITFAFDLTRAICGRFKNSFATRTCGSSTPTTTTGKTWPVRWRGLVAAS